MALTPSGAISLGDINTALNRSATAAVSMNDTQLRFLANQDAGSVNMNAMRDKQSTVGTITVGTFTEEGLTYIGFQWFGNGSLSSNSFFDGVISDFIRYPTGASTGATYIGGFEGPPGFPSISARLTLNGITKTMTQFSQNAYASDASAPFQITASMVGNTYAFQFAQT